MAQSPAHKLGQMIGEALEAAIYVPLLAVAKEFDLYLDYKHMRPARGRKKKVAWTDSRGNTHDLDYVLEEEGQREDWDVQEPLSKLLASLYETFKKQGPGNPRSDYTVG